MYPISTKINIPDSGINLQKWNVVHKVLSPTESDLIKVATKIDTNHFPTEKQCVRILQVLERARDEGFPE